MSFIEANEKIAEKVVGAHKAIEKTVVGGYKATEKAAVTGFNKVSDKFIGAFFTKDNETVEEAKARMSKMDFNQPSSSKNEDK
ncbi:TPA: hypothetical protein U1629_000970 [Streptococcus suis]|uniref:hypothetical protein n=1 Tax=Streptococcus TaxID=1301 RepID=UPI000CF5AEEA|nr:MULTISPECIES: hypothetical protein [Streptococcus]MBM7268295.1 hypothetical protein [Streptococcus suis]MBY0753420.1 hypothetical protein [Streptococcus sp. 2018037]MCK3847299.1 hypothetical protein [Streptococcus suis]MCK4065083.1 hypothetical protein [Streptococcus suis]MCK4075723.1 hypothetical protein [Streptococcus suis]